MILTSFNFKLCFSFLHTEKFTMLCSGFLQILFLCIEILSKYFSWILLFRFRDCNDGEKFQFTLHVYSFKTYKKIFRFSKENNIVLGKL